MESKSVENALKDVYSSVYFTFDIAYPKQLYLLLLFIQHHIIELQDNQPIPNVVNIASTALLDEL